MFDPIRNQYALRCPETDENTWVSVSSFRSIKRLRGANAPAIFRVNYDCSGCDQQHLALVPHDRLDWEPLGTDSAGTFTNLMTGERELVGSEMGSVASDRLRQGKWPWTFWCHPESQLKPGFPSSLRFVTPEQGHSNTRLGVLVRCFSCQRHTVNIVTSEHLDVPWHNDDSITFVEQIFDGDRIAPEERFRHQLEWGHTESLWIEDAS